MKQRLWVSSRGSMYCSMWPTMRLKLRGTRTAMLGWVSVSYLIAVYSTVRLGQPFPVVELSEQAIETILGVNVLKVVENIFEHNDGPVFGKNNTEKQAKRDC